MKDLKLYKHTNIGDFDRDEDVYYNLNTGKAEIEVTGGQANQEDVKEKSKVRFQKDLNIILRLAKKELPIIQNKITNNRIVFNSMKGAGNQFEMDKARRHWDNNNERIKIIEEFLLQNGGYESNDLKEKLLNLQAKHTQLNEEYDGIYVDGSTVEEENLVRQMEAIEITFINLDMKVQDKIT